MMTVKPTLVIRDWSPEPEAEAIVSRLLNDVLQACPDAVAYKNRLHELCGVRLRDLLDHITFDDEAFVPEIEKCGWTRYSKDVWRNDNGLFPDFVKNGPERKIAFRCESVEQFLKANGLDCVIEGKRFSSMRQARVFAGESVTFWAVERTGHTGYDVPEASDEQVRNACVHYQTFLSRRREFDGEEAGFDYTDKLIDAAVADLGKHWTCALFGRADREHWMMHCEAGRYQKARQDAVGIGWSNLDHVAYDASRKWFDRTIAILEKLGYECRELFYAGADAGWGSQVLEQPVLRSTIFADVDLAPEELNIDFAHMKLPELPEHRRAGMWCAMHGESVLQGGINHVAGLFDQRALRHQLGEAGIGMMEPFSQFDHLYQELTEGEWRAVDPKIIDRLEAQGHMTHEAAENFRMFGAIGNHLENIERNDGYKGFNQPGIDGVLRKIDPRKNIVDGDKKTRRAHG
jgi:hypothetical protein